MLLTEVKVIPYEMGHGISFTLLLCTSFKHCMLQCKISSFLERFTPPFMLFQIRISIRNVFQIRVM